MKVIIALSDLPADYDSFVDNHPQSVFFHRRQWLSCLQQVYGFSPRVFTAVDEQNRLVGILPACDVKSNLTSRRLISLPFSYLCPPLVDSDQTLFALAKQARETADTSNCRYVELKTDRPLELGDKWHMYSGFKTYRLNLKPSLDEIWGNCHKSVVQRAVRKAEREGITIRRSNDTADAAIFDYLNRVTSRSHGIPPQPKGFFEFMWQHFMADGSAEASFAMLNDRPVAAIIVFYDHQRAIYMYGASLPQYLELRPNHLLLWEAIKRAHDKKLPQFDFGRVSPDNTGLAEFKERWGTEAVPLHYYYWPSADTIGAIDRTSTKFKLATIAFSKLPLSLTSRLSFLYRHLA